MADLTPHAPHDTPHGSTGVDVGHSHSGGTTNGDDIEQEKTPSGRDKAQGGTDPFTSRLPDEFFDELREKRGFGRKLTALRGVSTSTIDPIIEVALRKISTEFGKRASDVEDRLASEYLSDVEAVTSRLNARSLPRTTRLLLTQRGVYVNLVAGAIRKMEGHTHPEPTPRPNPGPLPPRSEREARSKLKPSAE